MKSLLILLAFFTLYIIHTGEALHPTCHCLHDMVCNKTGYIHSNCRVFISDLYEDNVLFYIESDTWTDCYNMITHLEAYQSALIETNSLLCEMDNGGSLPYGIFLKYSIDGVNAICTPP